jgi:hypothetical protein
MISTDQRPLKISRRSEGDTPSLPCRRRRVRAVRITSSGVAAAFVATTAATMQGARAAPFNVTTGLCNLYTFVPFTDRYVTLIHGSSGLPGLGAR